MNTKQAIAIRQHGEQLERVFGPTGLDPMELCRKLHRIEARAHRIAVRECSEEGFDTSEDATERRDTAILDAVDRLLGFRAKGIPVFLNKDPRGYSLKIDYKWLWARPETRFPRDWGGYGIIAPEIEG